MPLESLRRPLDRFLETDGESLALCVLIRVHAGGRFFESVRRFAGNARVVFNTIDLHFLREEREALLKGDASGLAVAAATRQRELYLVRQADATIVVSSEERRLIEAAVPGARVFDLPLAREVHWPSKTFDVRSGIGFVGGFAHGPNVDALQFFLSEIWPIVLRGIPDCEFTIAGPGLPSDALTSMPERVRYLGHVPDLSRWFDTLRVSVAPLRYGAGAKGKVASVLPMASHVLRRLSPWRGCSYAHTLACSWRHRQRVWQVGSSRPTAIPSFGPIFPLRGSSTPGTS